MPLERFIPKSPDPFIRNSQDFEVAKFGHLNTIIEYVNSYVVTDSLQLSGTGPLTSTARYITDSLGNASSLAISTVNIGIGITTPGAALEIYGGVDTLGISGPANQAKSIQIARYNNSSFQSHYIGDDGGAFFGSGLTISASGTASQLYLQVSAAGRNVNIGSAGQTLLPKDLGARLGVRGSGTTSATTAFLVQNSAGTNILQVRDDGVVRLNNLANLDGTGIVIMPQYYRTNADPIVFKSAGGIDMFYMGSTTSNFQTPVGIGVGFGTIPLGRLQINGSGSTSATTSLLVQNSSGTESLKVQDDNIVRTTYLGIGGGTSTNNIGGTHIAQFGNAVSAGDQIIVVDSVSGSKRGFKFGNQGTIRMALIQDGVNLQIGNYVNPSAFVPYTTFDYLTGNVGIGTTTPAFKTQISSSGTSTSISTIASSNYNLVVQNTTDVAGTYSGIGFMNPYDTQGYIGVSQITTGFGAGGNMLFALRPSLGGAVMTEYMRLLHNGNLLIGTTTDLGAKLGIKGSGSTSATTSLLVQNSGGTDLLRVYDNNSTWISNTVKINATNPSTNAMSVEHAGAWNGTIGLFARSAIAIYAASSLGADAGNPDGASIVAVGGAQAGYKSVGLRSNRAIISAGSAVNIVDSAMLQVDSTTQGFLPPRMTTAQRTAIVSPAAGLIVYDTTTNKSYTYDGTAWQAHY